MDIRNDVPVAHLLIWMGMAATTESRKRLAFERSHKTDRAREITREQPMVTNYPQQLAAATEVTGHEAVESGLAARMITRLGQVLCGLHGHDAVLHFEANRVMMRCTSCGH